MALVRAGQFREDLFYRLNVLPLRVPPLRERRSDIAALVEVLSEEMAQQSGTAPPELAAGALALLAAQHWRGNIRELRNVLEQAAMRSDSQIIDSGLIRQLLMEAGVQNIAQADSPAPPIKRGEAPDESQALLRPMNVQIAEVEQRAIAAAMQATQGNKLATSRLLGISRATLYERLENPD